MRSGWLGASARLGAPMLALLLLACQGPAATPAPAASRPASGADAAAVMPREIPPASTSRGASGTIDYAAVDAETEAELNRLYPAARSEGEVVIYATIAIEDMAKLAPAFEARFPGIKIQHVRADSEDMVARFLTERRGGRILADVLRVANLAMFNVYQEGVLTPYDSPARKGMVADVHQPEAYWSGDALVQAVMGYNTSLVAAPEAPQTFDDLADPKWRGKLIGGGDNARFFMALLKEKYRTEDEGIAVWRRIAANQPDIQRGQLLQRDLLAVGQGGVCTFCYTHHLQGVAEKGAPVAWAKREAVLEPTAMGLIDGAPHPNAGKLFITWYLSRAGQEILADVGRIPSRQDVPLKGGPLLDETTKLYAVRGEYAKDLGQYEALYREIFGLR
jgi:iron(III) transport system substrate-binding protein